MSPESPRPFDDPRVLLAAERTLLAWIRTGIALMGLGFVVARFGLFLRELEWGDVRLPASTSPNLSPWFGTALLLLGIVINVLAAVQHVRLLRRLERGEPYRPTAWSLSIVIAVVLSAFGLGMIGYLLSL